MEQTIQDPGIDGLVQSVYELSKIMHKRMLSCDTGCIHMGQIHALLLIHEKPDLTMKELADGLRVTSPSATSFVDKLVKLEYVDRFHDSQNRRLVRLKILPKGQKFLKQKMLERRKIFLEVFGTLPKEDQKALLQILHKVVANFRS